MNTLLNTDPEFRKHPLYRLLCDCINVATGGGGSVKLQKAFQVNGWNHEFVRWDGAYSVEQLTWQDERVFEQLKQIYM